jgi:hypothetical protein
MNVEIVETGHAVYCVVSAFKLHFILLMADFLKLICDFDGIW